MKADQRSENYFHLFDGAVGRMGVYTMKKANQAAKDQPLRLAGLQIKDIL
ncbi:MAG: hypothetical protein KGZ45_08085 [Clostridium sp.]|nr:hypothetical protein [Clostridium sp.]